MIQSMLNDQQFLETIATQAVDFGRMLQRQTETETLSATERNSAFSQSPA